MCGTKKIHRTFFIPKNMIFIENICVIAQTIHRTFREQAVSAAIDVYLKIGD